MCVVLFNFEIFTFDCETAVELNIIYKILCSCIPVVRSLKSTSCNNVMCSSLCLDPSYSFPVNGYVMPVICTPAPHPPYYEKWLGLAV